MILCDNRGRCRHAPRELRCLACQGLERELPLGMSVQVVLALSGLVVKPGMTTPRTPGKKPIPVWSVRTDKSAEKELLVALGGDSAWSRYEPQDHALRAHMNQGAPTYYSFWTDPSLKIANALLLQRHLNPAEQAQMQDMDKRTRVRRDQLYAIYLDAYTELMARRVLSPGLTGWSRSAGLPEALARACAVEDAQAGVSPRSRLAVADYIRQRLDVLDEESP